MGLMAIKMKVFSVVFNLSGLYYLLIECIKTALELHQNCINLMHSACINDTHWLAKSASLPKHNKPDVIIYVRMWFITSTHNYQDLFSAIK